MRQVSVGSRQKSPKKNSQKIVAMIGASLLTLSACEKAERHNVGEIFKDCDVCPSMIVVPAGSFMMGSPDSEKGRLLDREGPQQSVKIEQPIAVGRFEITVGEFRAFLSDASYKIGKRCISPWIRGDFEAKSRFSFERPGFRQKENEPAICVSWNDAQAYVAWLSKKTGKLYRLLSEAEWEYVARAGTDTPYWWGDKFDPSKVNYLRLHIQKNLSDSQVIQDAITLPVNSYSPNEFGLHNTQGNAAEWTQDCWHKNYDGHPLNGSAWLVSHGGDCKFRVIRGGSWVGNEKNLRSAFRDRAGINTRLVETGFRVARELN